MDSVNERLKYSRKIINKYPDCVPVIIRKNPKDKNLVQIEKEKYLIPKNLTMSEIIFIIRKHIKVTPQQAIYIFVGSGTLVPTCNVISDVYDLYKASDEILYITYTSENTFG
jgi:GABA(A) receptor-associated protein